MSTAGLEALTGVLYKVCGDLISQSKAGDGVSSLVVKQSHSDRFKDSLRGYVKGYNKEYGTQLSVSFPSPFQIQLRERRKSARSKR
jgi:hypothetical protein